MATHWLLLVSLALIQPGCIIAVPTETAAIAPPPTTPPPPFVPDCSTCEYFSGIGYVPDPIYCCKYYVCYRDAYRPDTFKYTQMCCKAGLVWSTEDLTCVYPMQAVPGSCKTLECPQDMCPESSYVNASCPYEPVPGRPNKYIAFPTSYELICPYGTVWNQRECTCKSDGYTMIVQCDKLIHFDFEDSFNSDSCYNFVQGDPYGYPTLVDGTLCLDGRNGSQQFLSFHYLRNWFNRNPRGKQFTFTFWFFPYTICFEAGIFSSNCYFEKEGSVLEVAVVNGFLTFYLGSNIVDTTVQIVQDVWHFVAVTFDFGDYNWYVFQEGQGPPASGGLATPSMPVNSHSSATIGYIRDDVDTFSGYVDDFCFYTDVLDSEAVNKLYNDGPSNTYLSDDSMMPTTLPPTTAPPTFVPTATPPPFEPTTAPP